MESNNGMIVEPSFLEIREIAQANNLVFTDEELQKKMKLYRQRLQYDPRRQKKWILQHPTITMKRNGVFVPWEYMAIERIEWIADNVFLARRQEIKSIQHIANSVVTVCRCGALNPVTGQWEYNDGVGAAPLQTEKGKMAIDWQFIKSGAVQMGAPASYAFARKNAWSMWGRIFGRDLGREDQIMYQEQASETQTPLNS